MASVSLNDFRVKHLMNIPDELKEYCKSRPHMWNGKFYLLYLRDSINYQFLLGNVEQYLKYITVTNQKEHSPSQFLKLKDEFSLEKMQPIKVSLHEHSNYYWIQDGVHRAAVILFKQIFPDGRIPLRHLDITISDQFIALLKEKLRATVGKTFYNGWNNRLEFGYHSFHLWNFHVQGQRDPVKRLNKMRAHYDFTGKSVLDLGCNTGGMLLHLQEARAAYGIDFDPTCIEFASYFSSKLMTNIDYRFRVADLNEADLADIPPVDVAFLLSLGSWVKDWRALYKRVAGKARTIFLETNNATEGVEQLKFFLEMEGTKITVVSTCSDDDITGNHGRATYMIQLL